MALLSLDLDTLEALSLADPAAPPAGHTQADVEAMRALRRKIRSHVIKLARQLGAGTRFAIAGRAQNYPDTVTAGNPEPQEAKGWSQAVLNNPNGQEVSSAFLIALYNDPDAPAASKALTIALGSTNTAQIDTALRDALIPLLPLMASGRRPGQ